MTQLDERFRYHGVCCLGGRAEVKMGGGAREGDATALPSQMRYKPDVYGEQLAGSMCVRLVELQPSQQGWFRCQTE